MPCESEGSEDTKKQNNDHLPFLEALGELPGLQEAAWMINHCFG